MLLVDAESDAVVAAADQLGYPVVVKASKRRVGRSARAGIALDLGDAHAVRDAVDIITSALGDDARALVVQRMAQPGVDARIHCTTDERLGPLIHVGLGSMQAAVTGEGTGRLAPLSRAAGRALLHDSHVGPALAAAGLDDDALVTTIVAVAQLMFDHPEIGEMDLNPIIVSEDGCSLTDATVVLSTERQTDYPLRRLG